MGENSITTKKKYLIMGWYQDFECPGGDCGLTCCSEEWNIKLTDDEIAMYRNLDNSFRDVILENIDFEKKTIKCSNGKCNLMNEEGYCNIYTHCGKEYMSNTCSYFPRMHKMYGDITELWVELVCPVVSGYLLDNKYIDFTIADSKEDVSYTLEEVQVYDILCIARSRLVSICQTAPGQFIAGKAYIVINTCFKLRQLCQEKRLTKENVLAEVGKYDNSEILSGILAQCVALSENYKASSTIIFNTLRELYAHDSMLETIVAQVSKTYPNISGLLSEWLNNRDLLESDIKAYTDFMRQNYPAYFENYLVYSLFTSWCGAEDSFGLEFYLRIIESMFINIYGMAHWKLNGELLKRDFSVIIAMIDRALFHSEKISKSLKKYISEKPDEVLNMTLMLIY